jgi:hypothetical protein
VRGNEKADHNSFLTLIEFSNMPENPCLGPRNRITEFDRIACQREGRGRLSIKGIAPRVCVCCACCVGGCCRVRCLCCGCWCCCVCCVCGFDLCTRHLKSAMKGRH